MCGIISEWLRGHLRVPDPTIQRQQVPVKAVPKGIATLPRRFIYIAFRGEDSLCGVPLCVDLSSGGVRPNGRKISFFAQTGKRPCVGTKFHREVKIKMPSNAILEQKQKAVAELAELIKASVGGVIVNYQGITVDKDTAMRKALREAGVKYMVVKNSLTGRACEICGYEALKENLVGMTAIAISENDPIAPAKILKEYDEKIESFKILAGYCDGEVLDANGVKELADIPSKEVLIAKFLGSIQSPVYKFAYAVKAVAEKMEEGAPAEEAAPAEETAPAEA